MNFSRITVAIAATLALSVNVFAEEPVNKAPVCKPSWVTLDPLPEDLGLSAFSVDPIKSLKACSDPDGDALMLVSVSAPATLDANGIHVASPPKPGQTLTLTYIVKDKRGATASGTLKIVQR